MLKKLLKIIIKVKKLQSKIKIVLNLKILLILWRKKWLNKKQRKKFHVHYKSTKNLINKFHMKNCGN